MYFGAKHQCLRRNIYKRRLNKIIQIKRPELDLREDARKLLGAVQLLGGKFGMGVPIKLLLGREKEVKIPRSLTKHPLFGSGKEDTEIWWKAMGRLLLRESLLEEKAVFQNNFSGKFKFPLSTTDITLTGKQFLNAKENEEPVVLVPTQEILSMGGRKIRLAKAKANKEKLVKSAEDWSNSRTAADANNPTEWLGSMPSSAVELSQAVSGATNTMTSREGLLQNKIYQGLLTLRSTVAADMDCMPYMIANNKTLLELAKERPSDKQQLAKVEGFPQVKVDKFGQAFLDKIKELLDEFEEDTKLKIVDSEKVSKKLPEANQQAMSNPTAKGPTIKRKAISYEEEKEEELPRESHSNQDKQVTVVDKERDKEKAERELWDDEIDERCLAGVLDEAMFPATAAQQQSDTRQEDNVWGAEEDWMTENNELENSLIKLESDALSKASPSFKKEIEVKRKPICYDSSDDESTQGEVSARRGVSCNEKLNKEYNRKKKLRMLLP